MKFLASDLDGTLVRDGKIDEKDLRALKKLKQFGHKIIISTGRSLKGVQNILKEYPFEYDYLVICNGGSIIDKTNKMIHRKVITNNIQNQIISEFYDVGESLIYYDDGEDTYVIKNESVDVSNIDANFFDHFSDKVTLEHALGNNADSQIMSVFNVTQSIEKSEVIRKRILEKYSEHVEAFRNQCFVDIVPKGCSKGNAIMRILEDEDQGTDRLYAVGDSLNDISMFNITDNSYTFNQAEEIVKPYADYIVDHVYEVVEDMLK